MISDTERAELAHLRRSLGEWALGDVRKAAEAGIKVGSFVLAANLIDVLARLAYSEPSENARAAWDEFVPRFLPQYAGHSYVLYGGFRSAVSHNYSLDGIRLTDGPNYAHRHWGIEEGERVLHLETFVAELEQAFAAFSARLETDDELRARVLDRVRGRPLLGIVGGYGAVPATSAASSMMVLTGGTHFGLPGAQAATGTPPRMAIPKGKPPKKKT